MIEKPSIGIQTFKINNTKRTDNIFLLRNLYIIGAKMKHTNKSRTNHKGPSIGVELCIGTPKKIVIDNGCMHKYYNDCENKAQPFDNFRLMFNFHFS